MVSLIQDSVIINVNNLAKLPKSICQLSSLDCLNLDHNQLTELPESLDQLTIIKSSKASTASAGGTDRSKTSPAITKAST